MSCFFCGGKAEAKHHLLFGRGIRPLAEEDGQVIEVCNACHNMAVKPMDRIHENPIAEKLSKALGQALWEKDHIERYGVCAEVARDNFIDRYGRSYL